MKSSDKTLDPVSLSVGRLYEDLGTTGLLEQSNN